MLTLAQLHPFASRAEAEHALAMPRIAELRGDSLADVQWYAERAVAAGHYLEGLRHDDRSSRDQRSTDLHHLPAGPHSGQDQLADKRAEELRRYGFAGWLRREFGMLPQAQPDARAAWQPISSVPRDMTAVLLFVGGDINDVTIGGFTEDGGWCFHDAPWYFDPSDVTHWMPLPDPPR